jgi:hypothetical protein
MKSALEVVGLPVGSDAGIVWAARSVCLKRCGYGVKSKGSAPLLIARIACDIAHRQVDPDRQRAILREHRELRRQSDEEGPRRVLG